MYVGGGGDCGGGGWGEERVFVVFSILERLREGWLNVSVVCFGCRRWG